MKSGTSVKLYVNGAQEASDILGSTPSDGNPGVLQIGYDTRGSGVPASQYLNGQLDEIRVSKVIARWLTNFTPPAAPYVTPNASSGYIGIGTANPQSPIDTASGAFLSSGGAWTNASDRNLKENFIDIDNNDILDRISVLPIQRWNYKRETADIMHIGPVAQDFWEQFGLGGSNTSISTIDSSGIALVGVQALDRRLETIATTSDATSSESVFASRFFSTLFVRSIAWLGCASNCLTDFFADTVHAHTLCADDVCVTRDQLKAMLATANTSRPITPTPSQVSFWATLTLNGNNPAQWPLNTAWQDNLGALFVHDVMSETIYSTSTVDTGVSGTTTIQYWAKVPTTPPPAPS